MGAAPSAADAELARLRNEMSELRRIVDQQKQTIDRLSERLDGVPGGDGSPSASSPDTSGTRGPLTLSGEGGVAFFSGQNDSRFSHQAFRVDEFRLFLESPVFKDTYIFAEVNLAERERTANNLYLGEAYLDFENLSKFWGVDRLVNARIGRIDIPFGEEYSKRDSVDNPLLTHSIMDFWGVDEGIEIYGGLGRANYVLAVQNGGHPAFEDGNGDKAVTGRVGYQLTDHVQLSLSAMRTGEISVKGDGMAELWLGNDWVRPLPGASPTQFHTDLAELDIQAKLGRTKLKAYGGLGRYEDDGSAAGRCRNFQFASIEGVVNITEAWYGATRVGVFYAPEGFPLPGPSFNSKTMTWRLWQASVGMGYRVWKNATAKMEYAFIGGRELDGRQRDHEDLLGLGFSFRLP